MGNDSHWMVAHPGRLTPARLRRITSHMTDNATAPMIPSLRRFGVTWTAGHAPTTTLSADEDPLPVFGRGLTLVDALADRWGTEHHGAGTTAWFVLEIDDSEASYA